MRAEAWAARAKTKRHRPWNTVRTAPAWRCHAEPLYELGRGVDEEALLEGMQKGKLRYRSTYLIIEHILVVANFVSQDQWGEKNM